MKTIEIMVARMGKPRFRPRGSRGHPVEKAVSSLNRPLGPGSMSNALLNSISKILSIKTSNSGPDHLGSAPP